MTIQPTEPSLIVTFNKQELEYIKGLTQNFIGNPADETTFDNRLRLGLFVAVSRALGYNMNPDGSISCTSIRGINNPINALHMPIRDDT